MVTWFYLGFMSGLRCDIICSAAAQWSYSRVSSIGGGQERLKEKLDRYKKDDVSVNKKPFEEERERAKTGTILRQTGSSAQHLSWEITV